MNGAWQLRQAHLPVNRNQFRQSRCSSPLFFLIGGLATGTDFGVAWIYPLTAWISWLVPLAAYELSYGINRQFRRAGIPVGSHFPRRAAAALPLSASKLEISARR